MVRIDKQLFFLFALASAFVFTLFSMQSCKLLWGDCWGGDLNLAYTDLYFYKDNQLQFSEDTLSGVVMYTVEPGTDLVFEYFHANDECKSVTDDEFAESVLFQIPAGTASFLYCDSDLQQINCIYEVFSFFIGEPYYPVVKGCIQGNQLNEHTWHIEMDVTVQIPLDDTGEQRVYVSDDFVVSDQY